MWYLEFPAYITMHCIWKEKHIKNTSGFFLENNMDRRGLLVCRK